MTDTRLQRRLSVARLLTDQPSGLWDQQRLIVDTAYLYDLMRQLDSWGPDALVDDLEAASHGVLLSGLSKRELVGFAAAAWNRALQALAVMR
jgi:hypothetical protein